MWQVVLMINGYFISILGAAMLIAAGYDIYDTSASWSPFLSSALFAFYRAFAVSFQPGAGGEYQRPPGIFADDNQLDRDFAVVRHSVHALRKHRQFSRCLV